MKVLRTALLRSVAAGVGVALLVWIFGVPLLQSVLVATAVSAAGFVYALQYVAVDRAWPDRIGARRHGTRREVARLAASLSGRERGVPAPTVARLRVIAEQRLGRAGIDPHDPNGAAAARRALGPAVHAVLFDASDEQPGQAAFLDCLTAVEHLAPPVPQLSPVSAEPVQDDARDHL